MSVDTNIYFPAHTRVRYVADAIGILLGNQHERDNLAIVVKGVNVKATNVPEMAEIVIHVPGRAHPISAWWHFETDRPDGARLLSCGITSPIVGIARPLAKFFGGVVDLNDSDEIDVDYRFKCPRKRNNPSDGAEWHKFWDDMMKLGQTQEA